MNKLGLIAVAMLMAVSGLVSRGHDAAKPVGELLKPQGGTPSKSTVVYVGSFDLDVWAGKPVSTPGADASASGAKKKETPKERANRLVESVRSCLVNSLENAGYTARRLRAEDPRPEQGLRIQGVFTQVDEKSRVRRALIGSGFESGNLQLFVSVSNLERPDQQFYEIADAKSADNKYGPVITISPYAPVAKFEFDKDADDKGFRDLGSKMAAELTALLNSNPMSTSDEKFQK